MEAIGLKNSRDRSHPTEVFLYRSRLEHEVLGTSASWGDNVISWIGARERDRRGFLLVRYEDLARSPESVIREIADYLDLNASAERVDAAVRVDEYKSILEPVGRWRVALPDSAARVIESRWGSIMTMMGYTPESCHKEQDYPCELRFHD